MQFKKRKYLRFFEANMKPAFCWYTHAFSVGLFFSKNNVYLDIVPAPFFYARTAIYSELVPLRQSQDETPLSRLPGRESIRVWKPRPDDPSLGAGSSPPVVRPWPRFPGLKSAGAFRWAIYMHNEEYKALLAFLIAVGFLGWRANG